MKSLAGQHRGQSTTNSEIIARIAAYWDIHIHDLEIATAPIGSPEFFAELDEYRFDKLHYLPRLVDFNGYANQSLLEIGCGVGIDLARFARGGAQVTGIDLSPVAIGLAGDNFAQQGLNGRLQVMNGEALDFPDNLFDVVYAHGVLQYTANPALMVREARRVLRPGGKAVFMVYNRFSWLNALSQVMQVGLEHEDAPILRKYSIAEYREMLTPFDNVKIIPERFPVKTQLHGGFKAALYNRLFVGSFNAIPRNWVRPFGWHLMAFVTKAGASRTT